jgi:hypothetical protein
MKTVFFFVESFIVIITIIPFFYSVTNKRMSPATKPFSTWLSPFYDFILFSFLTIKKTFNERFKMLHSVNLTNTEKQCFL